MEPGKQFKNPPLIEVVFEIIYNTKNWGPIVPMLFYEKIKDLLPVVGQNTGFGFELSKQSFKLQGGPDNITQFKNKDNDTIVQLSNRLFTVNKLPIYTGWESYFDIIQQAYNVFREVLPEVNIDKIGLKAINKIDIQKHHLDEVKKYFNYYPTLPKNIGKNTSSIEMVVETPIQENEEILALRLQTIKKEPDYEAPVLFQYYVLRIANIPEDILEWASNAHGLIRDTFDKSLTSLSKEKFDE
jgi:uncharacterized protein (TIGR04255 family)